MAAQAAMNDGVLHLSQVGGTTAAIPDANETYVDPQYPLSDHFVAITKCQIDISHLDIAKHMSEKKQTQRPKKP